MQVSLGSLPQAYEEYIRWQAFALWARAVVESEGCAPSWLKAILAKTLSRVCGRSGAFKQAGTTWTPAASMGSQASLRVCKRGRVA